MNIQNFYRQHYSSYEKMIRAVGHERALVRYFRNIPVPSGSKILDAGCGSGAGIRAIIQVAKDNGATGLTLHGFDFLETAVADLKNFGATLVDHRLEARVANVLHMADELPNDWRNYDLIISSGMLEYLPKSQLASVLAELRSRLTARGEMIIFISRATVFNRLFLGGLWRAHTYSQAELQNIFTQAGFHIQDLRKCNTWGYAVRARA